VIRRHHIPDAVFTGLATGAGGPHAIELLRDARLSKHLLLLKYIVDEWPGNRDERDGAVDVLNHAQARSPEAVTELLRDPMVGSWAAWTARRIRGSITSTAPLSADLGHLAAIATAAAVRAGTDADLTGYVRDGQVAVPGLGAAQLPVADFTPARLGTRDGTVNAAAGGRTVTAVDEQAAWYGLRRLTAYAHGCRVSVALDDVDPYRDRHHIPAAGRVPADRLPRWRDTFRQAWELVTRYAPERADELTAGLRSVVPLAAPGVGPARSATARDAFGSFGSTEPDTAADFAVTLVHEFQHSKLSALLDLVPLYDGSVQQRYFAPWRMDPRPAGGLLQGVYAFLAVADTWRLLRADPALAGLAEQEFADIREQVDHAVRELSGSSELTAPGRRFVAGIREAAAALLAEPLPEQVVRRARERLVRNREAWHTRNGIPERG